ncbi:cytidine deaminase family protein [Streptococcus acidominimus]|uniref:Cytidine deaminase n=1 Tax=Streptococcus acidominimus TaxID=1326 RepID=A0A4Y9FPW1_STRAI|nr:cytidine deaminase [Streptococcus acidominimus]MBF0818545.1 cytidine deaminase [Streptococcus acidominimus]MBF0839964.1 cytidine deaminase [Streptococcus acidominimus]MBF0848189.1 cytidine deaminase [Streptococcus danieliae]TFU31046.1 cytidine deaminase [Streptococcus acidominimus]
MDSWAKLYEVAKQEYAPQEVTPFVYARHVVAACEAEDGQIFSGFCMEATAGVFHLCAERAAAFNMYQTSGQTSIKRMIAFRDQPPYGGGSGMPCGACREFLLQLSLKNQDMEIMLDYAQGEVVTLKELMPYWWGTERYQNETDEVE